jgi:hypothetical protein
MLPYAPVFTIELDASAAPMLLISLIKLPILIVFWNV